MHGEEAVPRESKQQKGHDRTTGLISVPRAQQKQISWLGTLFLDSSKSSYPDFPVGETSSRSVRAGLAAAAEHLEQIRMSSHTSDFHRVSSAAGASAQRQDAGGEWVGMELLRTKQARKQGWEASISSRMSRCVLIFFSRLPRCLNVIILHLPLFDCYLPLLVAYVEAAACVGLDRQHTQFSQACTDTLYQRLC